MPSEIFENVGSQSTFIKNIQNLTIAELIELYAYAEAIVETVREPLIILDKDFHVKSANKGFFKTFQTTPAATIGKEFFSLGNGQWDIPELRHLIHDVLPKKINFEDVMVEHDFPDIGKKIMLLNGRCVVLSKYRTQLILIAIEDVTERMLIERRTEKFIGMASHELRTPLTSIKVFMQILERKLKSGMDEPTTQIFARVMKQLNLLNDLIQDLFDVRKIKEGMLSVDKKLQRIRPIVEEAVSICRQITDTHTITLTGTTTAKVRVDHERIIQLLTNLLSNAVKYSPAGTPIKVKIAEKKNTVVISVHDEGPGISKAAQRHLFEAYYTVHPKTGRESPGLGLYISREIVRLHGGEIWLKSDKNKGTTFFVSLLIAT